MADKDEKIPHLIVFYANDAVVNVGVVWAKDSGDAAKEFWKNEPRDNVLANSKGLAIWKLEDLHPSWKYKDRSKKK